MIPVNTVGTKIYEGGTIQQSNYILEHKKFHLLCIFSNSQLLYLLQQTI